MCRFNILGIVLGFSIGCIAIGAGCPDFYTVNHANALHETLASR
jgi:hypothetical protein